MTKVGRLFEEEKQQAIKQAVGQAVEQTVLSTTVENWRELGKTDNEIAAHLKKKYGLSDEKVDELLHAVAV